MFSLLISLTFLDGINKGVGYIAEFATRDFDDVISRIVKLKNDVFILKESFLNLRATKIVRI